MTNKYMSMATLSLCASCVRWKGRGLCEAYPGGVPLRIRTGRHNHREHYPGDGGLLFEQDPDKPKPEDV